MCKKVWQKLYRNYWQGIVMNQKLEVTVEKTIEALARIGRFIDKYGNQLDKQQTERINKELKELQKKTT